RGLWIGLGAVTAILALAAIAWFLPRILSTNASQKSSVAADGSTPAPQASTTPQEPPSATPQQPPTATAQPTPDNTGPKPQPPVQGPAVPTAPHKGKESGGQDQPRQPYVPPMATQPVAGGAGLA